MKFERPDYENEAEHKYNFIVLLIVLFVLVIYFNYEKIIAILCEIG